MLEKAIEVDPNHYLALRELGFYYKSTFDLEKSLDYF